MAGKRRPSMLRNRRWRNARHMGLWWTRFWARQRRARQPLVVGRREDFE